MLYKRSKNIIIPIILIKADILNFSAASTDNIGHK